MMPCRLFFVLMFFCVFIVWRAEKAASNEENILLNGTVQGSLKRRKRGRMAS